MLLLFHLVVSITEGLPTLLYPILPGLEVDGTTKVTGEPSQESAVSPYSNPPLHIHVNYIDLTKGFVFNSVHAMRYSN